MSDYIVLYYSRTGNNKFVANRIAEELQADIEEVKTKINPFFLLMMLSQFRKTVGVKPLKHDLNRYSKVILCSPIWMGNLVSPVRSFLKMYNKEIKQLVYVTSCGSSDFNKDEKFGYNNVFKELKQLLGGKLKDAFAVPVALALPDDLRNNQEEVMKIRLDETNFKGDIYERFQSIIAKIK